MAGSLKTSTERDDLEDNHEINVVPFIDIMLVLLVVFMVAAPLATVDVNVDLPASTAEPQPRPDEPLYLTLKEDLSLAIGNDDVAREALGPALDRITGGDLETRIFLQADQAVSYRDLMEVMNLLRTAGYLKIALVGLESVPAESLPASGPDAPAAPGAETSAETSATPIPADGAQ